MANQISDFVSYFYSPIPNQEATTGASKKDSLDLVAGYANSTPGAWDLYRVFNYVLTYLQSVEKVPNLLLDRCIDITSAAGAALSVPTLLVDLNNLRKSVASFFFSQDLPYSDDARQQKIAQATRKSIMDGLTVVNTTSQAAMFFNQTKLVNLAPYLPVVDLAFQATSFITDSSDILDESHKIKAYDTAKAAARTEREVSELDDKIWLSKIKIVRNIASLAGAVLGLAAIGFGIVVSSVAVIATASLAFSSMWLAMKIAAYFYERVIEARHSAPMHAIGAG